MHSNQPIYLSHAGSPGSSPSQAQVPAKPSFPTQLAAQIPLPASPETEPLPITQAIPLDDSPVCIPSQPFTFSPSPIPTVPTQVESILSLAPSSPIVNRQQQPAAGPPSSGNHSTSEAGSSPAISAQHRQSRTVISLLSPSPSVSPTEAETSPMAAAVSGAIAEGERPVQAATASLQADGEHMHSSLCT